MGGRGARSNSAASEVSQELAVRVCGRGRARRLALFCGSRLSAVWVVDLDKSRKKEGVTGTMGSRTGREGETACLARPEETPQGRRLPAWGFPYGKSDNHGGSLKESLEMPGLLRAGKRIAIFKEKVICQAICSYAH